jgi:protein O-GlcNAc transferase
MRSGTTLAGRVAGSLLRAVGLDELITTSLEKYEALALRLARDAELLSRFRTRLAGNRLTFPLFDTERSTRNLEAAYRRMCEIRRAGQSPASFLFRLPAEFSREIPLPQLDQRIVKLR